MMVKKEREVGVIAMEDAMDALLERFVQPLLPRKLVLTTKPSISQQQDVAKQMHAVAVVYNYYHRKNSPGVESISFETICKTAVNCNAPLLAYLDKTRSNSDNHSLSLVEENIMCGCNIATALSDQDPSIIEMWPIETVAVFLADAKRENCFLNKDTLVKGVFSLVEKDVEGQRAEDVLKNIALSEIESLTGINQANLRTWYSQCTYSIRKIHSRTMVFLVECSEPPTTNKGFVRVSIKDILDSLRIPVFTGDSKRDLSPVDDFICLLPYADIISHGLRKPATELEELEKSQGELAKSSNKSPMKIDNPQVQVKKKHSNGSLKVNNGNDNPANKRENATTVTELYNFPFVKHDNSSVGPPNSPPTKDSMRSFVGPSINGSLKPINKGEESNNNNKRENCIVKEISKDANKELVIANSNPNTPTKRPIIEAFVKQEIVPVVKEDYEYCLYQLMDIRDYWFRKHRLDEDKIAQLDMDLQISKREGQMTPKVAKIVERWVKTISSDGQLDFSAGCSNPNKKKKFRFRSSCQEMDDFCRDNNLPLPRYCVYPLMSNGSYMATAIVKSMDINCTSESDLKMTPQDAREEAASRLIQKFKEMEED